MTTIKLRRGTAAQWTAANPILAAGEPGVETDTGKFKMGNGTAAWSALSYFLPGAAGAAAWGGITGTLASQTDLQTALDGKVDENAAITGATKTKVTYDAKGLITAGADATTADIADSLNKRYVTDAQLTVIGNTSGTNTGNQDLSGLVPYTGATTNINLGANNLVTTGQLSCGGVYDAMVVNGASIPSQLAVNSDTRGVIEAHTHNSTPANGAIHYNARSRGTNAAPTIVAEDDYLGSFGAVGYDGTDYALGARIDFIVDGTPGNNDMPTGIEFGTSADGSQSPTTRLTIDSAGASVFSGTVAASNLSGTNTGNQTSIVGISGTKAEFDTACSDGNFLYVGDITGLTDGDKGDIAVSASGATWTIDNGVVTAAKTSITGTPDGPKYLRDDFSWATVSGGSGLTQPQVMARLSVGY